MGLTIFFLFKLVGYAEETLQALPYYRPNEIKWYHKFLAYACNSPITPPTPVGYEQNKIELRIFGFAPTKFFRDVIYHPWAILTRTNRKREILMVDILTTEGSLYSGALSTWVQTEHTFSEIAMEYVLRYYPDKVTKDSANSMPPPPSPSSISSPPSKKSQRKISFVRNNGEFVISKDRIETIHFWEIRKGFEVGVPIKSENDLERLKWFLVLAFVYPKFISRISILVENPAGWPDLRKAIGKFIDESRIKFRQGDIVIDIVRKKP